VVVNRRNLQNATTLRGESMATGQSTILERDVLWQPWSDPGIEHLHLVEDNGSVHADGLVIFGRDDRVFRLQYEVRCTSNYEVRETRVALLGTPHRSIELFTDGGGTWTGRDGLPLPALDGCTEVDISESPFTNTLPIRRLRLASGQSAEILVAYVTVPDLDVYPAKQRYTFLGVESNLGVYRYEGLGTEFTADVRVDGDGLVVEYPELCRRLWSR
jgi:uncharacterized protein